MKFKFLLSLCIAGTALSVAAQGYKDGIEYYKADQYANAKELLSRNLNNADTDKAASYYYLGCIERIDGNTTNAMKYFNDGVTANPDYAYNYVGLGALALQNHNSKEATDKFKIAEGKGKKDAGVQIAIARAYYQADPVLYEKEIEKRIEKARKINHTDADIYMFEGDMAADQKDWGKSAGRYEMATSFQPDATEGYVKGSAMYLQLNPKYSIQLLKNLLERNPNSALGQRELADKYYLNGYYKEAAEEYAKYIKNPNHFKQDEDRYSFLLFYDGKYQEGYNYATKLLQQDPTHFTAQRYQFMNAAQIPAMKDQLLPMAENLLAAHSDKNKFAAIDYTLIADEFKNAGRIDDAIAVMEMAIKDMPDNASFNKQLAMIYVDANQISKAADVYTGYLKKTEKPGFNDYVQQATFSFYGGIETKKTDPVASDKYFADAAKYAVLAAKEYPESPRPKKIIGDIAIQKAANDKEAASAAFNPYMEAISIYEAASDKSKYNSDAKVLFNYMGNYYLDQKDIAKAKEYFNKYLEIDPTNSDYRKFVESL